MRSCLSDDEILGFVSGETASSVRPLVHDHLGTCSRCRVLVAQTRKAMPLPAQENPSGANDTLYDADPQFEPVPLGSQIGRYQIGALLGSGGAGLVYEAFDPQLSRKVALKILRPDKRSPNAETDARRLLREARAMAQLSHPAVVAVYDAGDFDGGVFLAMELVQGRTLARWLSEEEHDWPAIVSQFVAAGQGLVAAHAAGLIHRDFKAENVLVGADGRPRVTDFGLARASQPNADKDRDAGDGTADSFTSVSSFLLTLTEAAAFAGTPAFMAPEQFRGARADQATDQFNFCASLYSALYHQRPFADDGERSLPNLARAVLAGHLRPAPAKSNVPPVFFGILKRGLALDRDARYPSMDELLYVLQNAMAPDKPARPHTTSRRILWASAAGLLLAAGFAAYKSTRVASSLPVTELEVKHEPPIADDGPIVTTRNAPANEAKIPPRALKPKHAQVKPKHRSQTARSAPAHAPSSAPSASPAAIPSPLLDGIKDPYGR